MGIPQSLGKYTSVYFLKDWVFLFLWFGGLLVRILLAIGNDDFSNIVRMHFADAGFDVLDNDVYHRNFLPELLEIERPDIVVLHDVFLPSDTQTAEENELELLKLISSWRVLYDDSLRVVVLSERHRQDPFLSSLVAHNVLDIFSDRQIPVSSLINQISEPPRFANVARFGVGHLSEPLFVEEEVVSDVPAAINIDVEEQKTKGTRRIINRFQTIVKDIQSTLQKDSESVPGTMKVSRVHESPGDDLDSIEEQESTTEETDGEGNAVDTQSELPTRSGRRTRSRGKRERTNDEGVSEHISLPSTTVYRERLIGTAVLAVTSIGPNVGATHTSIQIASYLKRKGNTVAIMEASTSGDFERLRELFDESEERIEIPFYVEGIPHYPYQGEGENIIPFLSDYQFVVIDLGAYEKTPLFTEFFRSQQRIVVASGADWKLAQIRTFIKKHGKVPFRVMVPMASKGLIRDLEEIYEGDTTFSSLPYHPQPYKEQTDTDVVFDGLYSTFLKDRSTTSSSKLMKAWLAVASAIAVVSILGMTYMYFG